jgi:hypothetical protein
MLMGCTLAGVLRRNMLEGEGALFFLVPGKRELPHGGSNEITGESKTSEREVEALDQEATRGALTKLSDKREELEH